MTGEAQGRLDVLRVITRLNVGGPARHALLLSKGLEPQYSSLLVAGTPDSSEGELGDPQVKPIKVSLVRPVRPAQDLAAFRGLRKLMSYHQPTIVHSHMAKAGALARLAALTTKQRPLLVHTFHGHVFNGYFGAATQRAIVRSERWLARRTDVLIAVSEEVRDALVDHGVAGATRVEVIPLGLDLSSHLAIERPAGRLRTELGIPPDAPLIASVARLVPIKDHQTLLEAAARLDGVHVAIVGDGPCRPDLEAQARELGIGDRIHFLGWRSDIAALLSDVDVVVLTSRNEGTPVALIEALACARAVVSTDVGGVRSVVQHEQTGLLVPAGDASAVASAVARLLASPELRMRYGEVGREYVRSHFSHERLLLDIALLYEDLIGR